MPGLRERKKQQTRETIVREALRLFRRDGYDATTIVDIAEAADISPRTFFGYFETKEAVVFNDFDEQICRLRERLEQREPGASSFDALREWVDYWVQNRDVASREQHARRKLIARTPALQAQDCANRGVMESLVAEHVAVDLGLPAYSLRPRMVSAAAVAALTSLGQIEPDELPDEPMSLVDEAVAFLQGGLDELRRR